MTPTPYLNGAILPPPTIADTLVRMQAQIDTLAAQVAIRSGPVWIEEFTERENAVLAAIWRGDTSDKLIARRLTITKRTVQTHFMRMFKKAGVQDRISLLLWVMRQGGTGD